MGVSLMVMHHNCDCVCCCVVYMMLLLLSAVGVSPSSGAVPRVYVVPAPATPPACPGPEVTRSPPG